MQIVIEMTEDDYKKVQDGRAAVTVMRNAIRNGKVLPKGHGDLVDRNELLGYIDSMQSWLNENGYRVIRRVKLTDYIQVSLPTIIEADKEGDE